MTTTTNAEVWQLVQEALHAHAEQLRRDAANRQNGGERNAGYRARLREQARLALAIEQMVSNIDPAMLAKFLMITQSRPQKWPGGLELWPVADGRDADERARMWAQAGHPYHPFSGGVHEKMCRVCTGDKDGPQHQVGEPDPSPREPFTGDLPWVGNPYPMAGQGRSAQ